MKPIELFVGSVYFFDCKSIGGTHNVRYKVRVDRIVEDKIFGAYRTQHPITKKYLPVEGIGLWYFSTTIKITKSKSTTL